MVGKIAKFMMKGGYVRLINSVVRSVRCHDIQSLSFRFILLRTDIPKVWD